MVLDVLCAVFRLFENSNNKNNNNYCIYCWNKYNNHIFMAHLQSCRGADIICDSVNWNCCIVESEEHFSFTKLCTFLHVCVT